MRLEGEAVPVDVEALDAILAERPPVRARAAGKRWSHRPQRWHDPPPRACSPMLEIPQNTIGDPRRGMVMTGMSSCRHAPVLLEQNDC